MSTSWFIMASIFIGCASVESKRFHRLTLSNQFHSRPQHTKPLFENNNLSEPVKHPLAKEGSFEMHEKHSGKFAKKSLAPFHVEGAPMFHFSIVPPKPVSLGDSSTAAKPDRGSFKIDDGGVIGGGTYEIKDDGVDVDINLKIARKQPKPSGATPGGGGTPVSPVPSAKPQTVAPALCPMPCPAGVKPGQVVTPKPANPAAGAQVTPAPKPGSPPSSPGASPTPAAATLGPGGATQTPQTTTAAPAATTTAPAGGAPVPTPAPAGAGGSDFENEALSVHNKFRSVHGVPLLTLNAEMNKEAAAYAEKIAQLGSLQHASSEERKGYGENLSMGCSSNKGGQTATNWYNEICVPGYTFGSEGSGGAGHFTQVVWKESKELGIGKAESEEGGMKCTYIVGRYNRAGNMISDFAKKRLEGIL